MALLAQLRPAFSATLAQFQPAWVSDTGAISVVAGFDGCNINPALTVITDATGQSPVVYVDRLSAGGAWRQFLFAVENAEGKTPLFQFNRATRSSSATPTADWLPLWTQDFQTWHRASAKALVGGLSGTIEWTFNEPLPAGRVYVSSHPMGRVADTTAYAQRLLADYAAIASPAASADSGGVFNTSPSELVSGRQVGLNPQYAIKLSWPAATTDGGPKRKLVFWTHIHAMGESSSWWAAQAFMNWVLDSADAAAAAFRANWDIYWYSAVTPNGLYGGHRRTNFRSSKDPNRDFVLSGASVLSEITAVRAAVELDVGGTADAFISWHGYSSETAIWIMATSPEIADPATRPAQYNELLTIGQSFFGVEERFDGTYTSGTLSTDAWWGTHKLGAKISVSAETQQNGTTDPASWVHVGESWAKTLQAVDAQGLFFTPSGHATASGDLAPLDLTAPSATATGSTIGEGIASGALPSVTLTVMTGTAAGTAPGAGVASGALSALTLTAPAGSASASANATASGALPIIVMSAPAGSAVATVGGDVTASGVAPSLNLTAPTGSAEGTAMADAIAIGSPDAVVILSPSGSAYATSAMTATTSTTAAAMLAAYQAAEIALLKGKETAIGDRRLRFEDLPAVRAGRIEWERRVATEAAAVARVPRIGGLAFKVADLSGY